MSPPTVVRRFPLLKTKAAETTPRESLLDILGEIDEGKIDPTGLFVLAITENKEEDGTITLDDYWWMAGQSMGTISRTIGWIEYFKIRLIDTMLGR